KLKAIKEDFRPYNSNTKRWSNSNSVSSEGNNSLRFHFTEMNTLIVIIDEICDIINNVSQKKREKILDCLNIYNVNSEEICNWLSNNQIDSNSTLVFGFFNYFGIGIDVDKQKAFELFQKAAELGNLSGINN